MAQFTLIFLTLLISGNCYSQTFLNGSFEDSDRTLPANWKIALQKPNGQEVTVLPNGVTVEVDNKNHHHAERSLRMTVSDTNNFVISALQKLKLDHKNASSVRISAWIRTRDCKLGAGLNATQMDNKGQRVNYTSSRQQETLVFGTTEWTRSEITVLLRPEAVSLEVMAYFYGAGTVWFDDIQISNLKSEEKKTAAIVSNYLETLLKLTSENSYYRDSIDWPVVRKELTDLSSGMQTYREAALLTNYLIGELRKYGDNHTSHMKAAAVKQFLVADIYGDGRKVEGKYLGNGIGYIAMPGFASMNDSIRIAFASSAHEAIRKIDTENKICGWVVDLRDDDGGSSPPMISGLGPILGDGVYAKSITSKKSEETLSYENGVIYVFEDGKKIEPALINIPNPYTLKIPGLPVSVLTGPRCGSSGEAAVAAFIGRPQTKIFGQPTAGYTIGNSDYTLPDSSMIFLASGAQTDRNGKEYPDRIFPDVPIETPVGIDKDLVLEAAKSWLTSLDKCKKSK